MSASSTLAHEIGGFFKKLGVLAQELVTGQWVTSATWNAASGRTEKVLANGIKIVEAPGVKRVVTVPAAWLEDKGGKLTVEQLRTGSWTRQETWKASNGVVRKTLDNGVKIVQKPGQEAVVTLPKRILAKAGVKI